MLSPVSVSGSPLSKGSSGSALGVSGLDVASSEPVTGKKIHLRIHLLCIHCELFTLAFNWSTQSFMHQTCEWCDRSWKSLWYTVSGEKRKLPEALTLEDAKRIRVMGDIPMELVNEVMKTITDPAAMLGPEVSSSHPYDSKNWSKSIVHPKMKIWWTFI